MKSAARRPWGERLIASPWRIILFPFWILYRPLIGIRNIAYNLQWFRPKRLAKPVISVGNIIAGGSGKTPFVIMLCEVLKEHNCHILSRGYKGDADGNDEARLMPVPVHCDAKRFRAGKRAINDGAELLILDDGFQHRQLHRDVDIVLIDATRPWGNSNGQRGAVLPLGFLREHPRSLARADVLVITRSDQVDEQTLARLQRRLQRFDKALLRATHQASHYTLHPHDESLDLHHLDGKPVVCVSGIAHPQAFEATVQSLGIQLVEHLCYPDHHHYQENDINEICAVAHHHHAVILCTSKDAVKIATLWPENATDLYILHIDLALSSDDRTLLQTQLDALLHKK